MIDTISCISLRNSSKLKATQSHAYFQREVAWCSVWKFSRYKKYWHSLASNFVATIGTFENHKQLHGLFILFGLTLFRRTRRWLAAGAGTAAFPCSWAPWALWPEPGRAWTCRWARISTSGARCKLGEDSTWNPASLGWPPTSWSIPAAIVPDFRRPSARTRCPACRNLEKAWSSTQTSNRWPRTGNIERFNEYIYKILTYKVLTLTPSEDVEADRSLSRGNQPITIFIIFPYSSMSDESIMPSLGPRSCGHSGHLYSRTGFNPSSLSKDIRL